MVEVFAPKDKEDHLKTAIEKLNLDGSVHCLQVDTTGVQVL